MSQEALEMFSLRELKEIQRAVTTTKTKHQFLQLLNQRIAEIEQKTLNGRFLLSTITTFDNEEREILKRNNLSTMADLVNHKVNELEGITERTKESLSWAQDFYNLDYIEQRQKPSIQKRKAGRTK